MIVIIPAIDIIDGECVRLTQGDYTQQTTYYKDPVDAAKRYEDAGLRRLHMVDLDGAKASSPANLKVLERVASRTSLEVQYGGGVKSRDALKMVFDSGAQRAICGSVAVSSPDSFAEWLTEFGPGRMILGADVKDGFVATHGWLKESGITAADAIERFLPFGLSQTIVTDISKDGMLQGPSFGLYTELQKQFPSIDVTVSGGISSMDDIIKANELGLKSVIVGKAIYENKISLQDIERFINGVN